MQRYTTTGALGVVEWRLSWRYASHRLATAGKALVTAVPVICLGAVCFAVLRAAGGRPCSVYNRLRLIRRRGTKHQHYLAVQDSPSGILPHMEHSASREIRLGDRSRTRRRILWGCGPPGFRESPQDGVHPHGSCPNHAGEERTGPGVWRLLLNGSCARVSVKFNLDMNLHRALRERCI